MHYHVWTAALWISKQASAVQVSPNLAGTSSAGCLPDLPLLFVLACLHTLRPSFVVHQGDATVF